jgi:hypothetical protein
VSQAAVASTVQAVTTNAKALAAERASTPMANRLSLDRGPTGATTG